MGHRSSGYEYALEVQRLAAVGFAAEEAAGEHHNGPGQAEEMVPALAAPEAGHLGCLDTASSVAPVEGWAVSEGGEPGRHERAPDRRHRGSEAGAEG